MIARLTSRVTTIACGVLMLFGVSAVADDLSSDGSWQSAAARGDYALALGRIEQRLEFEPESLALKFARARVLAWSGELVEAAASYRELIDAEPADADYAFGYAQVMVWMGSDELALSELGRARRLAPEYEAVWQLEAQLLSRLPSRSRELALLEQRAAQQFPGSVWWTESSPAPRRRAIRIDIRARTDSISNGTADWQSRSLRVSGRGDRLADLYAGFRRESRFGLEDSILDVGGSWLASERWAAGLDVSLGRDPDFSPQRAATVWVSRSWPSGWEAGARLRASDYTASSVSSVTFNAARYLGDFRLGYAFVPTQLSGSTPATTHIATLDYYRSERTSLRLTLAAGEEVEAVGPDTLAKTDVRSVAVMLQHPIAARWDLGWQIGTHRQGDLYRRQFVAVSVSARL